MKSKILIAAFILLFTRLLFAQNSLKATRGKFNESLTCKSCHNCQFPTAEKPCLWPCPRYEMIKSYKFNVKIPDVIVIDRLSKLYGKVVFPHRVHAKMSEISGGCVQCHHYTTDKKIRQCADCHSVRRKRTNITRPDLRGAYHQKCMKCHIQWSHTLGCNTCHAPKNMPELIAVKKKLPSNIPQHKIKRKPGKIIFLARGAPGKFVTFYHKEHVKLFGLKCSDCHHNEKCINCHDVRKNAGAKLQVTAKPGEKLDSAHKKCSYCHAVKNNCSFCHSNGMRPPFNHKGSTGWALNRFHKKLKCVNCHGWRKSFTKLNSNCASCHSDWAPENFKHEITGLVLDENHVENDCETCHKNREYDKASCDDCHENKSYPKSIPGKLIEIKRKGS